MHFNQIKTSNMMNIQENMQQKKISQMGPLAETRE